VVREPIEIKWKFPAKYELNSSAVIYIYKGMVYFGSYDGNLYALVDKYSREEKWRFDTDDWIHSSVAISKDRAILVVLIEICMY
jgi:outer membrane protein assembly factor BamB